MSDLPMNDRVDNGSYYNRQYKSEQPSGMQLDEHPIWHQMSDQLSGSPLAKKSAWHQKSEELVGSCPDRKSVWY